MLSKNLQPDWAYIKLKECNTTLYPMGSYMKKKGKKREGDFPSIQCL